MAKHIDGVVHLSTKDILLGFINRKKRFQNKINLEQNIAPPAPTGAVINHIAVVLDGKIEEIIRAENRLAALFLSNPDFIEFDPQKINPQLGWTYLEDKFFNDFGEEV